MHRNFYVFVNLLKNIRDVWIWCLKFLTRTCKTTFFNKSHSKKEFSLLVLPLWDKNYHDLLESYILSLRYSRDISTVSAIQFLAFRYVLDIFDIFCCVRDSTKIEDIFTTSFELARCRGYICSPSIICQKSEKYNDYKLRCTWNGRIYFCGIRIN